MKKYKYIVNKEQQLLYNGELRWTPLKKFILEHEIYVVALAVVDKNTWEEIYKLIEGEEKFVTFSNALFDVERFRSHKILKEFKQRHNIVIDEDDEVQASESQLKEFTKISAIDNIIFKKLSIMKHFTSLEEYLHFKDDEYFVELDLYIKRGNIELDALRHKDIMLMFTSEKIKKFTFEQKWKIFYDEFSLLTLFLFRTKLEDNETLNKILQNPKYYENIIEMRSWQLEEKVEDYEDN